MGNKRGDIEFGDEGIPIWIIALVFLAILLIGYFILKDKGSGAVRYFMDMLRGRGR